MGAFFLFAYALILSQRKKKNGGGGGFKSKNIFDG